MRIRLARHDLLACSEPAPSRSFDTAESSNQLIPVSLDLLAELAAIDRCERRALSRRKLAIRALDTARAKATSSSKSQPGNGVWVPCDDLAPSSGYIHEVENGDNAVFRSNDDRTVLVDCVTSVFQLRHSLRQKCRKI